MGLWVFQELFKNISRTLQEHLIIALLANCTMPASCFSLRGFASKGEQGSEQGRAGICGVFFGGRGVYFHYLHTGKPLPTCRVLRKTRNEAFYLFIVV